MRGSPSLPVNVGTRLIASAHASTSQKWTRLIASLHALSFHDPFRYTQNQTYREVRGRPQGSPPHIRPTPAPTMTTVGGDVHCRGGGGCVDGRGPLRSPSNPKSAGERATFTWKDIDLRPSRCHPVRPRVPPGSAAAPVPASLRVAQGELCQQ